MQKFVKAQSSFTLIELLIVIAILAVLGTAVVLIINPAELLRQSRDSQRLYDLQTINRSLTLIQVDRPTAFFGTSSMVYVSLPDATTTCANLGLPALPGGWSYFCASPTTYRKVDGTGWLPVNFTLFSSGSPLSKLPIDPINSTSTGEYYTYTTGGSWHLTAFLTSQKYKLGGQTDKTSQDGGSYPELLELGSNFNLLPISRDPSLVGYWKFDEGSGSTAYDASGHNNTGTWNGSGSHWTTGRVGAYAGQFAIATSDYVDIATTTLLNGLSNQSLTVVAWIKLNGSTGTWQLPIAKKSGSSASAVFDIETIGSGSSTYAFYIGDGASSNNGGGGSFNWGEWVFVAGTAGNGFVRLYTDGVLRGANSITISNWTNNQPIQFGGGTSSYKINGLIDDVRIYNRALSAAEIQAIYNASQ